MGADPIHGQKGIANVNRGQQGRCGPVVHRVLGQGLQPAVIDELAARDIRFEYSLHAPLQGREAVRAFAEKFRAAFPDLNFWGTADLIAEGEYVVGQWEGGGTQTGDAFDDMPYGPLPASTGKAMRFTGATVLKVENGLITEEDWPTGLAYRRGGPGQAARHHGGFAYGFRGSRGPFAPFLADHDAGPPTGGCRGCAGGLAGRRRKQMRVLRTSLRVRQTLGCGW